MLNAFVGSALPLNQEGFEEVIELLSVGAAELWAVLEVETNGCGFIADRRPEILYERHVFRNLTDRAFDAAHPDISNKKAGGYGAGGANQYERLTKAIALDRKAALRSASWGIGQVMGFNAEISGYADEKAMIQDMMESEHKQLIAMAGEIKHNNLDKALRSHDWTTFARGYNGAGYAKNSYDYKLASAYQKFNHGPLPDLVVRAAQIYLMYLEYQPGPIDGWLGKITRSALNEFQRDHDLAITQEIDSEQVEALKEEVEKRF